MGLRSEVGSPMKTFIKLVTLQIRSLHSDFPRYEGEFRRIEVSLRELVSGVKIQ